MKRGRPLDPDVQRSHITTIRKNKNKNNIKAYKRNDGNYYSERRIFILLKTMKQERVDVL